MTSRKSILPPAAVAGALLISSGIAHAATIFGVNFTYNAALHVSGTHFGASAWTSSYAAQGNTAPVSGSFSTTEAGVGVAYSASNWWSGGSTGTLGAADEGLNLFMGYLDDTDDAAAGASPSLGIQTAGDGIGAVFQITGLGAWLASNNATSYNVTLILGSGQAWGGTYRNYSAYDGSLQGTLLGTAAGTVSGDGGWDGVTDRTPDVPAGGYRGIAEFSNLDADTLTITGQPRSGSARGSISGFVITAVPEPSSILLGFLGVPLLLRRKR